MRFIAIYLSVFLMLLDTCISIMYCRQFRSPRRKFQCMADCCKGQYRTAMCQPMEYCYGDSYYTDQTYNQDQGYYQEPGYGPEPGYEQPELDSGSAENENNNNLESNQQVHFYVVDNDDGISVHTKDPDSRVENFDLGDDEEDFTLIGIIAIPLSHLDKFDKEGASIVSMSDFARLMMEYISTDKKSQIQHNEEPALAVNKGNVAVTGNGGALARNGGAITGNGVAIAGNGGAITGNGVALAGNGNSTAAVVNDVTKEAIASATSDEPLKGHFLDLPTNSKENHPE